MTKESFMMVSLKGDKAKKLAQVMSNPTCTRILEYLSGKDATETQIAKDLNIPLSTVHYNMQQLAEAKLVLADEFHYSDKGREVTHYKLAKQYIIIAPDDDDPTLLDRLKKFVPVAIITIGLAAVLKTMQFLTKTPDISGENLMMASAPYAAPEAAGYGAQEAANSAGSEAVNYGARSIADAGSQAVADSAADAVGGAAPMMMAKVADVAANETANQAMNETINQAADYAVNETSNAMAQEAFNSAALDSANQAAIDAANNAAYSGAYSAPIVPWWQSPMIDYFLLGAVFVLVILIITESIFYWRSKKKN